MARSTYIYVVMDPRAPLPVATFTVKHEMVGWLKRTRKPGSTKVYRYGDGPHRQPVSMDIEELFQ